MSYYDRKDKIIDILMQSESISVSTLADRLFVSIPTLRRDLVRLEKSGLIIRTHGGAKLIKNAADANISFAIREEEQSEAKIKMAKKAISFIKDGDTIMMDATTSAYTIIPYLKEFKNIIVITSSAKASFLLGRMGINNICTGGNMINSSFSYVGADALNTVSNYNADVLFFSCRGLNESGYLTDNSLYENQLRKAMMKHSKKKIFLCDSKKIGNTYLNNLCHISEIDEIISENPVSDEILKLMK